jgi:hypothetical protein
MNKAPVFLGCGVNTFLPIVTSRLNYSRISQNSVEPRGSLLCSNEPATGPCPETDESNSYYHISSRKYLNMKNMTTILRI